MRFDPTVYVLKARNGKVLYVGVSGQFANRLRWHAQRQPWWREVATIDLHTSRTMAAAERRERSLILKTQPKYGRDKSSPIPPRGGRHQGVGMDPEVFADIIGRRSREISAALGCHHTTISCLRIGRRISVKLAQQLADHLGVEFDEVFKSGPTAVAA